ncbi:hypothetical protein DAI22_05g000150 [Oryza sativa Japonica Group]|nr:hypothetical protein DAI22_05g000150 [Oryza sativa Japonica Group]
MNQKEDVDAHQDPLPCSALLARWRSPPLPYSSVLFSHDSSWRRKEQRRQRPRLAQLRRGVWGGWVGGGGNGARGGGGRRTSGLGPTPTLRSPSRTAPLAWSGLAAVARRRPTMTRRPRRSRSPLRLARVVSAGCRRAPPPYPDSSPSPVAIAAAAIATREREREGGRRRPDSSAAIARRLACVVSVGRRRTPPPCSDSPANDDMSDGPPATNLAIGGREGGRRRAKGHFRPGWYLSKDTLVEDGISVKPI